MDCLGCGKEMEQVDTTYSNIDTERARVGDHTGDIYECEGCEKLYIDDLLTGHVAEWSY